MFYEERMIDGLLYYRSRPDAEWRPISTQELSRRAAQVTELVKAGQEALNIIWVENLVAKEEGNIRYEATTKAVYDKLQAAVFRQRRIRRA